MYYVGLRLSTDVDNLIGPLHGLWLRPRKPLSFCLSPSVCLVLTARAGTHVIGRNPLPLRLSLSRFLSLISRTILSTLRLSQQLRPTT